MYTLAWGSSVLNVFNSLVTLGLLKKKEIVNEKQILSFFRVDPFLKGFYVHEFKQEITKKRWQIYYVYPFPFVLELDKRAFRLILLKQVGLFSCMS